MVDYRLPPLHYNLPPTNEILPPFRPEIAYQPVSWHAAPCRNHVPVSKIRSQLNTPPLSLWKHVNSSGKELHTPQTSKTNDPFNISGYQVLQNCATKQLPCWWGNTFRCTVWRSLQPPTSTHFKAHLARHNTFKLLHIIDHKDAMSSLTPEKIWRIWLVTCSDPTSWGVGLFKLAQLQHMTGTSL